MSLSHRHPSWFSSNQVLRISVANLASKAITLGVECFIASLLLQRLSGISLSCLVVSQPLSLFHKLSFANNLHLPIYLVDQLSQFTPKFWELRGLLSHRRSSLLPNWALHRSTFRLALKQATPITESLLPLTLQRLVILTGFPRK